MKKGLKLLLIYFISLLVSLVGGTLIYALYLNVLNYVAGSNVSNFSIAYIENAFFYVAVCVLVLICPLMCYYRTRHPAGFIQTLFYILICAVTWGCLMPLVNYGREKFQERSFVRIEQENLTKNLFRSANGHVYYFIHDFYTNPLTMEDTPAVVIDTSEEGGVDIATVKDSKDFELYSAAAPYREILIKDSIGESKFPKLIDFSLIIRRCELAWQKGWTFYLGFLTLAFVLCALYAFSNYYKWKLITLVMFVLETAAILIVNTLYFNPSLARTIFKLTNNRFFTFLNHYMDEPLLCFINFIAGLIFIIIGIVHFAVKKHKKA